MAEKRGGDRRDGVSLEGVTPGGETPGGPTRGGDKRGGEMFDPEKRGGDKRGGDRRGGEGGGDDEIEVGDHETPSDEEGEREEDARAAVGAGASGFFRSSSSPQLEMVTGTVGRSFSSTGTSATLRMTSSYPRMTLPNTTCLPERVND